MNAYLTEQKKTFKKCYTKKLPKINVKISRSTTNNLI